VIVSSYACTLTDDALIHLRGREIAKFLQGQLSCDCRKLTPEQAVIGALCNVKGRVISDLTVIQCSDEHCLLRLRASLAAEVAQTLVRYAQFSRISVELDPQPSLLGIYGEPPSESVAALPLLEGKLACHGVAGLIALRRGDTQWELIAPDPEAAQTLRDFADRLPPGTTAQWSAETLKSGHYALETEDSGLFTPQALNYDRSGLVAFDKGCYTGQEVIARLHYKGHSKRRLGVLSTAAPMNDIERGAPIFNSSREKVGTYLRSAADTSGQYIVAAELSADQPTHALSMENGTELKPV
jgi:folate-binding protein YgfZ